LSEELDPFENTSAPSVSFKGSVAGQTKYRGTVTRLPELVQSRDFETGDAAFWPDGNKKMSAVIGLEVDGEPRSLWAAKPSSLFTAIGQAQKDLKRKLQLGDEIEVAHVADEPNKNPRLADQKIYKARILPGEAAPAEDPWAAPAEKIEAPF
jgi:hypothetical protein